MADAQTPVLTDEQILAIGIKWAKEEGWFDFERNDFIAAARELLAAKAPAQPADAVIPASHRAVMQQALDAIDVEFSDEWECNAYHPKLHAARAALFAALSATMEKPNGK